MKNMFNLPACIVYNREIHAEECAQICFRLAVLVKNETKRLKILETTSIADANRWPWREELTLPLLLTVTDYSWNSCF